MQSPRVVAALATCGGKTHQRPSGFIAKLPTLTAYLESARGAGDLTLYLAVTSHICLLLRTCKVGLTCILDFLDMGGWREGHVSVIFI